MICARNVDAASEAKVFKSAVTRTIMITSIVTLITTITAMTISMSTAAGL